MSRAVLVIAGTRPEIVKLAPIVTELRRVGVPVCVGVTGQHQEMLSQTLLAFDLEVDYDMCVMAPKQSLPELTSKLVGAIDRVVAEVQPVAILVQGDTTTAFCGALVSSYHKISVGHVEAGLRTGEQYSPFPEEMNRRLIARLATWHFSPTPRARVALIAEGVSSESIYLTGNTIVETVRRVASVVSSCPPPLPARVASAVRASRYILVTGHRRENTGAGLESVCSAILQVSAERRDFTFVYVLHLNPAVRRPAEQMLGSQARVVLSEPLAYQQFIWLLMHAWGVITDSGGVQEEAFTLGTRMVVTRDSTERPEVLSTGLARLSGTSHCRVVKGIRWLLEDRRAKSSIPDNPLGDGKAANRIARILDESLRVTKR